MSEHLRGSYGASPPELRLVLLGNIGCGKTSSADTILGQLSHASPSASRSCQLRQGVPDGRNVTLVEAPRWYWAGGKMDDSVKKETERAMMLLAPGPHAFLLLVPVSQFTEMEGGVPAELEEVFGEGALDHTLVLLTCGDYLMGRKVEHYLQKEHPGLRKIIERCGGRYHVINNRQRQDREQVCELLEKVDSMVAKNGVYYMKTAQERELEKRVKERKQELLEKYRAQKEERREMVASKHILNTETLGSIDRGEDYSTAMTRRSKEQRDVMEESADVSRANGLRSTPAPEQRSYSEPHTDREVKRTPSFRLSADGAKLLQMSEMSSSPKVITTLHHRINSFEERSPEPSPTSAPHSPVFSSSPTSLENFASSPLSASSPSSGLSPSSASSPPSASSPSSGLSPSSASSPPSASSTSYGLSPSSASSPPSASSTSYGLSPSSVSSPPFASSTSSSHSLKSFASSPPSASSPSSPPSAPSPSSASSPPSALSPSFASSPPSAPSPSSPSSASSLPSIFSPSTPSSASPAPVPSSTSFSPSFPLSSSSSPELRLVLLGRSGAGKSAAGNEILGCEEFETRPESLTAITRECEKKKALVEGRQVAVVDTPDWFNSEQTPDEVRAQISSCVALSSPGPHAFLMCVPLDQPSKTELQALGALESVFGPEAVQKHTLVLFTYADRLRESGKTGKESVEAYIAGQRGDLLELVERCRDRFHVMEKGGGLRDRGNVAELLEKVEQTVKEAGGQCYSGPAFQEAESRLRQKQVEIARERKKQNLEKERGDITQFNSERRVLHSYMQPVAEAEEEVREDEIEQTRDEAEMSVKNMNIESLPPVTLSTMSPSLLRSIMEKMESSAKNLPKLLADSSVWVTEGAKKVKSSPVWGNVGSGAQNVHKMVVESAVWGKVGASAGQVSKLVGDRVPKVVLDGTAWVGSGAKAAAASPMWEKVGSGAKSGAKLVANSSMRVGAGAKNLAQSPMWGKVGSGAKTGAKLMAESSARVGAGISAGAKQVAQSPVWGKVGSGAKAGAKMVTESSVWEKIGTTAKKVPKVVIGGALLGLVLGVFFGGVIGGAVGAAAGSAVSEVGRRKFSNKNTSEKTDEAAKNAERTVSDSMDSLVKQGEKVLKTE